MAFNNNVSPLTRRDMLGSVGDATSRTDSVKYSYGYVTADTAATVEVAGYFNAMATTLTVGDIISAVMNAGVGATPVYKEYVVTAITPNVTLALQTGTAG